MSAEGVGGRLLAPLLEEARPLAAAVGPPEVAAAGAVVAAVLGAVVARASPANARPPEQVNNGASSEQRKVTKGRLLGKEAPICHSGHSES